MKELVMINAIKQKPSTGKRIFEGRLLNKTPNIPNLYILFSTSESIPKKGINIPIFAASLIAERILSTKRKKTCNFLLLDNNPNSPE